MIHNLPVLVKTHRLGSCGPYLLAGDEVVVSKAGKHTRGVGKFYSSLANHPIPSVSFLALSLIDVERRQSYPLQIEQLLPKATDSNQSEPAPKRGPGRPKGRKNYEKPAPKPSLLLQTLQTMLASVQALVGNNMAANDVSRLVRIRALSYRCTTTTMVRDSSAMAPYTRLWYLLTDSQFWRGLWYMKHPRIVRVAPARTSRLAVLQMLKLVRLFRPVCAAYKVRRGIALCHCISDSVPGQKNGVQVSLAV